MSGCLDAGMSGMIVVRVPNRGSPPAVLLRESYREAGKVKNRTLANLSSWPEAKVDALSRVLKGQPPPAASLEKAFEITRSLPHGHVAAVLGTARQLGLEELIDPVPSRQRDLVAAMTVAQVIAPDSKLATGRGLREETAATSLGEVLALGSCDEDDLYAAMDYLHGRQEQIQDALAARHLAGGTLVLYDVSSAAFEGRTCPLGAIGHPGGARPVHPAHRRPCPVRARCRMPTMSRVAAPASDNHQPLTVPAANHVLTACAAATARVSTGYKQLAVSYGQKTVTRRTGRSGARSIACAPASIAANIRQGGSAHRPYLLAASARSSAGESQSDVSARSMSAQRGRRYAGRYFWARHPAVAGGSVQHVHAVSFRVVPSPRRAAGERGTVLLLHVLLHA
jgi:hypothetical protein